MPRPRCRKNVNFDPQVKYFKPAGIPKKNLEEVVLNLEEVEALRLKDALGMSQIDAAKKMGVSQPTFHRLILCARQKLADGVTGGKSIKIIES